MAQAAMQYQPALFRNVPAKDTFHLFDKGRPNAKKVVELLNYKKEDVAVASDISVSSVRYDAKMPEALLERMREWATAINLVGAFFNDEQKTMLWFQMPNPLLGNMSPRDMIRVGRFGKLLKFIQTALDENKR
jgi:hypothetical protein